MARLPKQHDNKTVSLHLNDYLTHSQFNQDGNPKEVNALDNILTGVANLEYGNNTRPLSKRTLFFLLAVLPIITSNAVKEIMQCSQSHARRLALALGVASRAFVVEIQPRGAD